MRCWRKWNKTTTSCIQQHQPEFYCIAVNIVWKPVKKHAQLANSKPTRTYNQFSVVERNKICDLDGTEAHSRQAVAAKSQEKKSQQQPNNEIIFNWNKTPCALHLTFQWHFGKCLASANVGDVAVTVAVLPLSLSLPLSFPPLVTISLQDNDMKCTAQAMLCLILTTNTHACTPTDTHICIRIVYACIGNVRLILRSNHSNWFIHLQSSAFRCWILRVCSFSFVLFCSVLLLYTQFEECKNPNWYNIDYK